MPMIKEFSKWIYENHFKAFKNIWRREKTAEQISPNVVLAFLNSLPRPNTKLFYLKYLVETLSSHERVYHKEIMDCYINTLLDIINKEGISNSKLNNNEERLLETGKEKIMSKQRIKEKDIITEEAITKLRRKILHHARTYAYYLDPIPFLEK